MKVGSVKSTELGNKKFPGSVNGSWKAEDNLDEACEAKFKDELDKARENLVKAWDRVDEAEKKYYSFINNKSAEEHS